MVAAAAAAAGKARRSYTTPRQLAVLCLGLIDRGLLGGENGLADVAMWIRRLAIPFLSETMF